MSKEGRVNKAFVEEEGKGGRGQTKWKVRGEGEGKVKSSAR